MFEQSKAARRRFYNGNFHNRYFNGHGVDIGGKPDPFSQYIGVFPLVKSMKIWDLEDGDAQYMKSCENESFDFVVSSHCLEHMVDVYEALKHWIRITKRGGYLVITVPEEDLYEQGRWPSAYNADHKWTFTIQKSSSWSEKSINIFDLLRSFQNEIEVEKIEKIGEFYNHNLYLIDQTMQPNVESAIEFIIHKKSATQMITIQNDRFHLEPVEPQDLFPQKFSRLFQKVQQLNAQPKKYLVYGYGSAGQIIEKFLEEKIVCFVDQNSMIVDTNIERNKIYAVENIKNIRFDMIIISILGRDDEVKEILKPYVDEAKLIFLSD